MADKVEEALKEMRELADHIEAICGGDCPGVAEKAGKWLRRAADAIVWQRTKYHAVTISHSPSQDIAQRVLAGPYGYDITLAAKLGGEGA